jgi:hypothetical protein
MRARGKLTDDRSHDVGSVVRVLIGCHLGTLCRANASATTAQLFFATTRAIIGSRRNAETSFTIVRPTCNAVSATSALFVSTEIVSSGQRSRSAAITGTTRRISSSGSIGRAPGRVDSPPTSIASAPSAISFRACATALAGEKKLPPSLKLSGVTLRMPDYNRPVERNFLRAGAQPARLEHRTAARPPRSRRSDLRSTKQRRLCRLRLRQR